MDEGSPPLEGEDIGTTRSEDARHWMSIYVDLLEFKRGILDRVRRDVAKLEPVAQRAAQADLKIIESQMDGYQKRLEIWTRRVWDLHGLWLDPEGRRIRYKGGEATLTAREFQLLQFLLDHPNRYFTVNQILSQAWAGPALFPEEVRNYVRRVQMILAALEIPCDLVNQAGRGYSLELRVDN
ncbi:MAG TPA: winged helix-turn-helix domain-containing protein [Candidatus Dormibacteraeota bacterium]|jgi:DNA-binding response OmpR family regulator